MSTKLNVGKKETEKDVNAQRT